MNDTSEQENTIRIPPNLKEVAAYLLWNRNGELPGAQEAMAHLEDLLAELPEEDAERIRNAIYLSVRERAEIAYQRGLEFGRFLSENQ